MDALVAVGLEEDKLMVNFMKENDKMGFCFSK